MLAILITLAFLFNRRVLHPLSQINKAVAAVAKGDLSVRSATANNDEFGELSRTFDAMAIDLVSEIQGSGELQMEMNLFDQLHSATLLAGEDNEVPDFLSARLLAVASSPHCYPDATGEVLKIIDMLPLYDTYAQTGYMGMGVSNVILEGAIRRLEAKRVPSGNGPAETT